MDFNDIKIDRVSVNYGFTQPTGDYQNIRIDVNVQADVPPGRDHNYVHDHLLNEAKMLAEEDRREIIRIRSKQEEW